MGSAYTIRLPFVGTRSTERPTLRPRPSYPGHPPAANEGLVSLVPDFILGPRRALDSFRRAAAAWSKRYNPLLFGTRSKASMDWAEPRPSNRETTSEPQPDEHGRGDARVTRKGPQPRRRRHGALAGCCVQRGPRPPRLRARWRGQVPGSRRARGEGRMPTVFVKVVKS